MATRAELENLLKNKEDEHARTREAIQKVEDQRNGLLTHMVRLEGAIIGIREILGSEPEPPTHNLVVLPGGQA